MRRRCGEKQRDTRRDKRKEVRKKGRRKHIKKKGKETSPGGPTSTDSTAASSSAAPSLGLDQPWHSGSWGWNGSWQSSDRNLAARDDDAASEAGSEWSRPAKRMRTEAP